MVKRRVVNGPLFIRAIDPSSCIGCGACLTVCEPEAIDFVDDVAVVAHPERCEGCKECASVCSVDAIYLGAR